jgi:hypothetical protein
LDFLSINSLSVPTIKNSTLLSTLVFVSASLQLQAFTSAPVLSSIISLETSSPSSLPSKPIFSPPQLLQAASFLPLHAFYQAAFSFAFLAMLRISN